MLAGKSRGGTPFCRMLKIVFPKSRIFCKALPLQLFPRNSCKISVSDSGFTRRGGLVRPASKSYRFSHHPLRVPKGWHGDFAACGQRSGLLAHASPAFLKNCWSKNLFSCLRLVIETPYSWKTNCVWFGRIASLSAFVLFAGGCVIRIAYECFLDCSLQEFFMFPEWRTAFVYFS